MAGGFIERTLGKTLKQAAREFPAVTLTGPRQSGKTTLLKHLFANDYGYVSLETPDIIAAANDDPRGFLKMHTPPVILDEVQNAPVLLPYIKEWIDEHRQKKGQYILTGSQNLLMLEKVNESLAGRTAILRLLPLSTREISGDPAKALPWENGRKRINHSGFSAPSLWDKFVRGFYPELVNEPGRDAELWHSSYIQTYIERDVRSLRHVGDITQFQNFLRMLAVRNGQLLNLSEMAKDLGLSVNTAKAWLSILEATFQVVIIRPYFANIGKRMVKTPKVYFTDIGTLCFLAGIREPSHIAASPLGGAIMEAAVLSEIMKTYMHRGKEPRIYFWRTSYGDEVDFIVDVGMELIAIEVKLSSTPRAAMAKGIKIFKQDVGEQACRGYVVHPGDVVLPLGDDVTAIPFTEL